MKYRKLRIAWSVAWGIAAVLLIALWVRSYWWVDGVTYRPQSNARYYLVSGSQALRLEIIPDRNPQPLARERANRASELRDPIVVPDMPTAERRSDWQTIKVRAIRDPERQATSFLGFRLTCPPTIPLPVCPHWFAVTLLGLLATAPWVRNFNYRFSLRTLLIATTLVAAGLGLIVYALRM
jgi:hypothetical protein